MLTCAIHALNRFYEKIIALETDVSYQKLKNEKSVRKFIITNPNLSNFPIESFKKIVKLPLQKG